MNHRSLFLFCTLGLFLNGCAHDLRRNPTAKLITETTVLRVGLQYEHKLLLTGRQYVGAHDPIGSILGLHADISLARVIYLNKIEGTLSPQDFQVTGSAFKYAGSIIFSDGKVKVDLRFPYDSRIDTEPPFDFNGEYELQYEKRSIPKQMSDEAIPTVEVGADGKVSFTPPLVLRRYSTYVLLRLVVYRNDGERVWHVEEYDDHLRGMLPFDVRNPIQYGQPTKRGQELILPMRLEPQVLYNLYGRFACYDQIDDAHSCVVKVTFVLEPTENGSVKAIALPTKEGFEANNWYRSDTLPRLMPETTRRK